MGKRYGKPYPREMRETEIGSRLYQAWKRMRRYPHLAAWDYFPTFYNWSVHNGYSIGAWLRQIDDSKEYGPDNCAWYFSNEPKDVVIDYEWAEKWDKTVNRIRKHYHMKPLRGTTYDDI